VDHDQNQSLVLYSRREAERMRGKAEKSCSARLIASELIHAAGLQCNSNLVAASATMRWCVVPAPVLSAIAPLRWVE
jgi:hypothetical protein